MIKVVPTTVQVQQVSNTVSKYTMVMQTQEVKEQVVVVYDSNTKESTIVSTNAVKPHIKPYYVTEKPTETGSIIESNSV